MQFKSFQWLSHHGIWAIKPCSRNMASVRLILGEFFFYFGFLYAPRWLSIISYPTSACGIIVQYFTFLPIQGEEANFESYKPARLPRSTCKNSRPIQEVRKRSGGRQSSKREYSNRGRSQSKARSSAVCERGKEKSATCRVSAKNQSGKFTHESPTLGKFKRLG